MAKEKLLWVSDNPKFKYVGQSRVTREICDRLSPYYDLQVAGFYEPDKRDGKPSELELIREWQYPINVIERNKEETLQAVIDKVQPELIVLSHDCWLFTESANWRFPKTKAVGYFTIDGDPVCKWWRPLLYNMDQVVVPANYAKKVLQERFYDLNVEVVPYGVDHKTFSMPVDKEVYKKQVGESLGFSEGLKAGYDFSNKFLCVFYGHNQFKKNIGCIYDAWNKFSKGKDDIYLLLVTHSRMVKKGNISVIADYDITEFMKDDTCLVLNNVFDDSVMSLLTKASDCLLFPTIGEGFGLPVLEALACGTTPLVTDFSGVTDFATLENSFMLEYSPMMGDWNTIRAIVHPDEMQENLETAYKMWKTNDPKFRQMKQNGVKEAAKYTWDESAKQMLKVLQKVSETPKNYRAQTLKRL